MSIMKCFGDKQEFALEYEPIDEYNSFFELWIAGEPICCFYRNGKKENYQWDLLYLVDWLENNIETILTEKEFPLSIKAKTAMEFYDISGQFDVDDINELSKWFEIRQEWYFRHSWYCNRAGSYLADVLFRRVENEKIEIVWDNTCLYHDINFVNPRGLYYVAATSFEQVIRDFISDYQCHCSVC